MVFCFDGFELDTDLYELRHNGQCRKLEPKVFDLLSHFARHPDRYRLHMPIQDINL